jgi:hypothetical protein
MFLCLHSQSYENNSNSGSEYVIIHCTVSTWKLTVSHSYTLQTISPLLKPDPIVSNSKQLLHIYASLILYSATQSNFYTFMPIWSYSQQLKATFTHLLQSDPILSNSKQRLHIYASLILFSATQSNFYTFMPVWSYSQQLKATFTPLRQTDLILSNSKQLLHLYASLIIFSATQSNFYTYMPVWCYSQQLKATLTPLSIRSTVWWMCVIGKCCDTNLLSRYFTYIRMESVSGQKGTHWKTKYLKHTHYE